MVRKKSAHSLLPLEATMTHLLLTICLALSQLSLSSSSWLGFLLLIVLLARTVPAFMT